MKEGQLFPGVGIAICGEIDSCGDDTVGVHAQCHGFEFPEAAKKQASSGEKHQRNGNLHGDQYLAKQAACGRPVLLSGEQSEEHTSELQSQSNLVCRLLLEKKKKKKCKKQLAALQSPISTRTYYRH